MSTFIKYEEKQKSLTNKYRMYISSHIDANIFIRTMNEIHTSAKKLTDVLVKAAENSTQEPSFKHRASSRPYQHTPSILSLINKKSKLRRE